MCLPLQDGQTPRPLHEKATRNSARHAPHRTRAKPFSKMPHATALGLPVVLTTYHLKEGVIVRVRPEPPDPVTVSRFVGEEGWLQPRLDLEFKDEVSRLLSASE